MATEDLQPTSVVGGSDEWDLGAGSDKTTAVNDDSDATYVSGPEAGQPNNQQYVMGNPSSVQAGDTLNSVKILARADTSHTSSVNMTFALRNQNGTLNTVNYQPSVANTGVAEYLSGALENPGVVGGAWDISSDLNDLIELEVRLRTVNDNPIDVMDVRVQVDYTAAATGKPTHVASHSRRRQ